MAKAARDSKTLTAQTIGRLRQSGLRPTRQRVELACCSRTMTGM